MQQLNEQVVEFLAEASRLRALHESARVDFYIHIRSGEATLPWANGGYETYDRFLDANDVVRVSSYRGFCAAVDRLGVDEVRALGIDAAIASLRAKSEEKMTEALAHMHAFVAETNKPVPAQTAQRIMDRYAPPTNRPQSLARQSELLALREENRALKKECEALRKKVSSLELQLEETKAA